VSAVRSLGVALVAGLVVLTVYAVFVRNAEGQRLDQVALDHLGRSVGSRRTISTILDAVTIGGMALALACCVLVALARRRWALAVGAVVLVAGSNLTTEFLKHDLLTRPSLGYGDLNSLPSGHTTVAASMAMAALLVVPSGGRWLVAVTGSVGVAVTGVGTVVAGWHRPSDVVAGLAVALVWGAAMLAVLALGHSTEPATSPSGRTLAIVAGLPVAAAVFLALGVRPDGSTTDLLVHVVIMGGVATVAAGVLALYTRMVDARFR